MNNVAVVVGDVFSEFAQHESVVTVSDLKRRPAGSDAERFVLGQGLTDCERTELALTRALITAPAALESLSKTHKRSCDNVLITELKSSGEHSYVCELNVADRTDRLSDHVTGEHIGGMILLEAGRQTMVAALESEYGVNGAMKWGLAWSDLKVRFLGYVYPLPVPISVSVIEAQIKSDTRMEVRVPVVMSQASKVVCEMDFVLTLVERAALSNLEHKRANRTLHALLADQQATSEQLRRPA
jgi:hypothetical protein